MLKFSLQNNYVSLFNTDKKDPKSSLQEFTNLQIFIHFTILKYKYFKIAFTIMHHLMPFKYRINSRVTVLNNVCA